MSFYTAGTATQPNQVNADYTRLPSWVVRSMFHEMPPSVQANMQVQSLVWRKLHLSKAKLKASGRTSALLAGFAMVAMVEVQISTTEGQDPIPEFLLVTFVICTTLLVAIHMLALMISTCILPNLEAVSNTPLATLADDSPHEKMHFYIELAWAFSTVIGILLFLCEIAILCWVKFLPYSKTAALSGTILLVPVILVFVAFAVHFYRKLVKHKYERSEFSLRELETMVNQLESGNVEGVHQPNNGLNLMTV